MRTLSFTALLLLTASFPAMAQRYTILLDPARGGNEYGARVDEHTYEKQVTLDLANRLRSLLNVRDFDVVLTRDADVAVTNEARAAAANTSRPIACLLLHSTSSGTGLHLYTTSLEQAPPDATAILWDEAQSPFVQRSQRLSNELTTAFTRSHIPVSSGRTWIRPLDNMRCPAIAIEIAPDAAGTPASDHGYQNRIASTIAGALLFWRGHTDVMQSIVPPPPLPTESKPSPPPAESKPPSAATPTSKPQPAAGEPGKLPTVADPGNRTSSSSGSSGSSPKPRVLPTAPAPKPTAPAPKPTAPAPKPDSGGTGAPQ